MKAKLIKTIDEQGVMYSLSGDNLPENYVLSLKNCQAIENGYDLDEMAKKFRNETIMNSSFISDETSFKEGAKAIIELLGDKKFSDEDVILIAEYIRVASQSTPSVRTKDLFNEYQSLQQTEWDVEIEMICPHPMDTYRCGLQYGCDGDGCNHPNQVPYLDADGCLILKRK